jgi:AcrR family transcriptional regulator
MTLDGRKRQAAANDEIIRQAAREVFVENPEAPIAKVAERAGVGISALYRRYAGKDALLGALCAEGQQAYIEEATRALNSQDGVWGAYVQFLRSIVARDTHSLSNRLAGTFTPTKDHLRDAAELDRLGRELFDRTQTAGFLRPDVTFLDVGCLLESLASVRMSTPERNAELRQRLLGVIIDGLRADPANEPLEGKPPTSIEQESRWIPRGATR